MKADLRQAYLEKRLAIPPEEAAQAAGALAAKFLENISLEHVRCVAGYVPFRGEMDVLPLMAALAERGIVTALPITKQLPEKILAFHRWKPGDDLVHGAFGIATPPPDAPVVTPDLLLVPLVAFDPHRNRLGYGGGYYDRTIAALRAKNPALRAVGIAFSLQQAEELPREAHDMALDAVVTEHNVIPAKAGIHIATTK